MKQYMWGILGVVFLLSGCGLNKKMFAGDSTGQWERATLIQDQFGSQLKIVRQNNEVWLIEAKTYCFWTKRYVNAEIWFLWGPVECKVKNDAGEVCEFWTKGKEEP
ncbi:hypothetical protein GF359_04935 [candidate division WOR-3 bacterium]|uniref:Lipoprotein n=1 Tax=candidate division WOR-3 bacterium TaxID=2052148 RepID=A0A9D5KAG2_UNCW3|nr:hypothetical protein [candidate division WOR-3 bacterium]MBD3364540.1 hypothetical protein [candidate division WOR-3 bacterium]